MSNNNIQQYIAILKLVNEFVFRTLRSLASLGMTGHFRRWGRERVASHKDISSNPVILIGSPLFPSPLTHEDNVIPSEARDLMYL